MFPELPDAKMEIRKPIASPYLKHSMPSRSAPNHCRAGDFRGTFAAPNF
jgi:hypothetical protein